MKNLVLNEIFKILSRKVVLEKPKDKSLAHYASPEAFALAKELRKAPKLIAEELAAKFKDSEILSATAVNGYLNFHLKPAVLGALAENALRLGGNFAKNDAELGRGILPASKKICASEPASKGCAANLAASGNDTAKSQNSAARQNFISQNFKLWNFAHLNLQGFTARNPKPRNLAFRNSKSQNLVSRNFKSQNSARSKSVIFDV